MFVIGDEKDKSDNKKFDTKNMYTERSKYASTAKATDSLSFSEEKNELSESKFQEESQSNLTHEYVYNSGMVHFNDGDYQEAIRRFTEAIKLDSHDSLSYCMRGLAYHILRSYEKALKEYSVAIELNDSIAEFYYARGITNYFLNRFSHSLIDCRKAIDLDNSKAKYFNLLGQTLVALKQYDNAQKSYRLANILDPVDATFNKNLVILYVLQHDLNSAQSLIKEITLKTVNNNQHNLILYYVRVISKCIAWIENETDYDYIDESIFTNYPELSDQSKSYLICEILTKFFFLYIERFATPFIHFNKIQQQKLDLACDQLSKKFVELLSNDPQNVNLNFNYGKLLLWANKISHAEHHFHQCTQIHPKFILEHVNKEMIKRKDAVIDFDTKINHRQSAVSNHKAGTTSLDDIIVDSTKFNSFDASVEHFPHEIQNILKATQKSKNLSETRDNLVRLMKTCANYLCCDGYINKDTHEFLETTYTELFIAVLNHLNLAWIAAAKHVSKSDKNCLFQNLQDWFYLVTQPEKNDTPANDLFIHKFEQNAKENPEHLAIIFNNIKITYKQLNDAANKLAKVLISIKAKNNLPDESRVVLLFENSPEAIISILAVMKSGLAYVPLTLDPKISYERLASYIIMSEAKLFLTKEVFHHQNNHFIHFIHHKFPSLPIYPISSFDKMMLEGMKDENPNIPIKCDQLAYCIFSSGTSGPPKGIAITHRGLLYPVHDITKKFNIQKSDRIGGHSLLTFDASLLDMMTALANAAIFVIIPQSIRTDKEKLTDYCNTHQINFITLVPSVLNSLEPSELPTIRGYVSTGESGFAKTFEKWHMLGVPPNEKFRIGVNGYGPSESTICTITGIYELNKPLHIGKEPVPKTRCLILKPAGIDESPYPFNPEKAALSESGELYITGDGLAKCYLKMNNNKNRGFYNLKEDYHRRFRTIIDPDSKGHNRIIRVYQTGDKVAINADGNIEFRGRIGDNNKLYGELIEPSAIENAINDFDKQSIFTNVKVSIKSVQKDKIDYSYLEVYLLSNIEINEDIIRELHFFLRHHEYCNIIPSHFRVVKEWPTNSNLKSIESDSNNIIKTLFVANPFHLMPSCEIGIFIREKWYKYLSINPNDYQISLDDNFFDLGGKSIHVTEMLSQIQYTYRNFPKDISLFYACPTIRALVSQIENIGSQFTNYINWQYGSNSFDNAKENKRYPVILINSVMGDSSDDFNLLIKHWKSVMGEWPLICTRILSITNAGYRVSSISHLASDYINAIKQDKILKNYDGPFILMGFSAGGVIAYEIARLFQEENRPTSVCCIDTLSPIYYQILSQKDYAHEIKSLMSKVFEKHMGRDNIKISIDNLNDYSKHEQLSIYIKKFTELTKDASVDNKEKYLRYLATIDNIITPQFYYKLKPIEEVTLISFSSTTKKINANKKLCWNDDIPLKNILVEGNHEDFFTNSAWVENIIMPKIKIFCEASVKALSVQPVKNLYVLNCESNSIDNNSKLLFAQSYIQPHISIDKQHVYSIKTNRASTSRLLSKQGVFANDNMILMNELLSSNLTNQKILIHGAYHIGKTTLLKYIRYLFALPSIDPKKPEWLKKYSIVFYVPLSRIKDFTSSKKDPNSQQELARFLRFILQEEFQNNTRQYKNDTVLDILNTLNPTDILWLIDGSQSIIKTLDQEKFKATIALVKKLLNQPNIIFTENSDNIVDLEVFHNISWDACYKISEYNKNDIQSYIENYANYHLAELYKDLFNDTHIEELIKVNLNILNDEYKNELFTSTNNMIKYILLILEIFPSLRLLASNLSTLNIMLPHFAKSIKENKSIFKIFLDIFKETIGHVLIDSHVDFKRIYPHLSDKFNVLLESLAISVVKTGNIISENDIKITNVQSGIPADTIIDTLKHLCQFGLIDKHSNTINKKPNDISYKLPMHLCNYFLILHYSDVLSEDNPSDLNRDKIFESIIKTSSILKDDFLILMLQSIADSDTTHSLLKQFISYIMHRCTELDNYKKCRMLMQHWAQIKINVDSDFSENVMRYILTKLIEYIRHEPVSALDNLKKFTYFITDVIIEEKNIIFFASSLMTFKDENSIQEFCANLSQSSNKNLLQLWNILHEKGFKLDFKKDMNQALVQHYAS